MSTHESAGRHSTFVHAVRWNKVCLHSLRLCDTIRAEDSMKKPKISSWPCTLHPASRATNELKPRCRECKAAWRKERYDAGKGQEPKNLFHAWCAAARRRGLDVDITFRQWLYIKAQPCVYRIENGKSATTGIDRINNRRGYVQRNCQPCCVRHNMMKSDVFTQEQMMDLVTRYDVSCGDRPVKDSGRSPIVLPS